MSALVGHSPPKTGPRVMDVLRAAGNTGGYHIPHHCGAPLPALPVAPKCWRQGKRGGRHRRGESNPRIRSEPDGPETSPAGIRRPAGGWCWRSGRACPTRSLAVLLKRRTPPSDTDPFGVAFDKPMPATTASPDPGGFNANSLHTWRCGSRFRVSVRSDEDRERGSLLPAVQGRAIAHLAQLRRARPLRLGPE